MPTTSRFAHLSAEEAAAQISDGQTLGCSGFTPAGSPKAVPRELARRAEEAHRRGEPFAVRVLTGASTGPGLDDALAAVDAISWRAPYQKCRCS